MTHESLYLAIRDAFGPDPHSGGAPHVDTVTAVYEAVMAMIAVSNARPAAYASEPWRGQSSTTHTEHAAVHADIAHHSLATADDSLWLSDLGQPEAAHAMMRLAFAMNRRKRGM